jgi:hypothetical protein
MVIFRNKSGYQVFRDSDGVVRSVHKRVLEKKMGRPVRKGFDADHINRNKNDNRPSNLRELPFSVNRSPKRRRFW